MMFRKNLLPISALLAATFIAGCSSYDEVANQEITVKSTPDDAAIAVNGKTLDRRTDTSLILPRDGEYAIVVSKAGYKPASVRVVRRETGDDTPGAPKYELDRSAVALTLVETDATRIAREGREAAERGEAAKLVGGDDLSAAESAVAAVEKAAAKAVEEKTPESVAAVTDAFKTADAALKTAADSINASVKTVGAASLDAAKAGDTSDPLAQTRIDLADAGAKLAGLSARLAGARVEMISIHATKAADKAAEAVEKAGAAVAAAEQTRTPSDIAAADTALKTAAGTVNEATKTVGTVSVEVEKSGAPAGFRSASAKARADLAGSAAAIATLSGRIEAIRNRRADVAFAAENAKAADKTVAKTDDAERARTEAAAREQAARDVATEEAAKKAAAEKAQAEADAAAEAKIIADKAKADAAKKAQADADAAAEAQILADKQAAEKRAAEAAAKIKADNASKNILKRYVELRRQLKTGEISPDEYETAVKELTAGK